MYRDLFHKGILAGDRERVADLTQNALDDGIPAATIINEYLMPAMDAVGRLYEDGDFFIPEMLMSARAMQASMALLRPLIVDDEIKTAGRVVIGTVEGDLHDIGKTLVSMMMESAGFEVFDLGVDVKPAQFVEAAQDLAPTILCMSAMLTTTMPAMEHTIDALTEAGLRQRLVIMVGGAPVTEEFVAAIGADGYAEDAAGAARRAKELVAVQ
jgi:5-methyltetrahydrofolate--homocysteine methyltransferase